MPPLIEADNVRLVYPNGFEALSGLSVRIERGEMIAVVGKSGAGKSTLLRIMNRLLVPTSGRLTLDGMDITTAHGGSLRRVRQRVGMIFQQFNLVTRLTVLQNVLVGVLAHRRGLRQIPTIWRGFSAEEREWARRCLDEVGIRHLESKRAGELSGGQQQRVAIARALAQRADVILADEPIASLDPHSAEVVMDTLEAINKQRGVAVVMNLHQVDTAKKYASRVIGLREGLMAWDLPVGELADEHLGEIYGRNQNAAVHVDMSKDGRLYEPVV